MVTQLLCRKLWRRTHCHHSPIHRTAENPTLAKVKSRDGYAVRAVHPALKGEVFRATDKMGGLHAPAAAMQKDCAQLLFCQPVC